MSPCLKLWAHVEQFVASHRTFSRRCSCLWYLVDGMGPVHSCSLNCFWLQVMWLSRGSVCQCCISVWHTVLGMPWRRKPNRTAHSAYGSAENLTATCVSVCCAAFTKGAHSLSLQSEVDSFTSLLGDSAKLLRPSPVHRDASWEVDLGRDCEGFSSFSPRRLCGCFECHSLGRTARKTDSYLCPSKCFQNIFLGSLGPEYFE